MPWLPDDMVGEKLAQFILTEEKEKLENGLCPCCSHIGDAVLRKEDQMYVCEQCASWAYRDIGTGKLYLRS